MTYGEKIQHYRKQANLTQQELGELLNLTPQAVSKWEHDLSEPDLTTLSQLAEIFHITTDDLINKDPITIETTTMETKSIEEESINNNFNDSEVFIDENELNIEKSQETQESTNLDILKLNKRRLLRGLILGSLFAIIGLIFSIFLYNNEAFVDTPQGEKIGLIIAMTLFSFTFFGDLFTGIGLIHDIISKCASFTLRAPGVIFSFDLDGFIFLIAIKALFWLIGLIVGILGFIVGLAVAAVVSIVHYPYIVIKLSLMISGKIKNENIYD